MVELKITVSKGGEKYSEGHVISEPELVSLCKELIESKKQNIGLFVKVWLKNRENGNRRRAVDLNRHNQK